MKQKDILIRSASIEDLETLKTFEQEVITYERQFASNLKADPIHYYDLGSLFENEESHIIIAEMDGNIIGSGYALIKASKPYKTPEKFVYLGFMYVIPSFRGRGINGMIIDNLIEWGKAKGHSDYQLDVYAENSYAISAYVKKGFQPYLLNMRLDLNNVKIGR